MTSLDLELLAYQILVTSYCQVVIFTFLACDHVDTLGREVNFIWKSRWSLAKLLFLLVRYVPYALLILDITSYK